MPAPHQTVVYDVHDFRVRSILTDPVGGSATYGASWVDVPGISSVSLDPNFITQELKGDAKVIAKKGRIDKFGVSATYGKLSVDVLAVVLGGSVSDVTDPTDYTADGVADAAYYAFSGENSLQYFQGAFKIDDVELGLSSLQVVLHKCQLTGGTLITGQTDNFGQPTLNLDVIPLESDKTKFMELRFVGETSPAGGHPDIPEEFTLTGA